MHAGLDNTADDIHSCVGAEANSNSRHTLRLTPSAWLMTQDDMQLTQVDAQKST